MSQHIFTTRKRGRTLTVTMGYDRPLDYVFCTVLDDKDEPVYCNLDDYQAGCDLQDVNYFRAVLRKLNIRVPESMYAEVANDQANSVGNRVVVHTDVERGSIHRRMIDLIKRVLHSVRP